MEEKMISLLTETLKVAVSNPEQLEPDQVEATWNFVRYYCTFPIERYQDLVKDFPTPESQLKVWLNMIEEV